MRQGCSLFPFLFLLAVEALSNLILEARRSREITGLKVSYQESISHLLFVDDVLYYTKGSYWYLSSLKRVIELFCKGTEMEINYGKSKCSSLPLWTKTSTRSKTCSPSKVQIWIHDSNTLDFI